MKKNLLLFLLPLLLLGCKKELKEVSGITGVADDSSVKQVPSTASGPGGTNCYNYSPLIPQPDGTLTGYIENVPIQISDVMSQAFDDNGNPIQVQDGDPFWGQLNITSSTPAEVMYNSSNGRDDQFVIRIYEMGGVVTVNLAAYQSDLDLYISGQNVALGYFGLPSYLFKAQMPKISNYLTTSSPGGHHDVTGRLIRINPEQVQVGTDASGNAIFVTTTYAWAPACYHRREGDQPTGNRASILLRNVEGCNTPSSVDFIQNGMVVRSISFPTISGTTSSPVYIPSGVYSLQFNIPAGYPILYFLLGSNSWQTGNSSNSSIIFTIPGTVDILAGTSYSILETTTEP